MLNPRSKHWVLVADGGQARILELRRKPYEFRQVTEWVSEAQHQPSRELVSDADGRSFHVQGPGSHAKQPRSDPHDQAEEQFTRGLVQKLDKAVALGRFDHLAVIAEPRTLGRLRRHMSKPLSARVTDELALDLASLPINQLEPKVKSVLGWKA
jgi:protein required for attachment to host cells